MRLDLLLLLLALARSASAALPSGIDARLIVLVAVAFALRN